MPAIAIDDRTEWLETDGRGGFACGTTMGVRTRRYHALLLPATTPPTGRVVLVNGVDVFLETVDGSFALSTQRYQPGVLYPDGAMRIEMFESEPWPTWTFELADGTRIRQELFLERETGACWMAWTLLASPTAATLRVRPFLSGRDYHALHHENPAFRFDVDRRGAGVIVRPYEGVPQVTIASNGEYRHDPQWYRNFLYTAERERGLDDTEDLASPGVLTFALSTASPIAALMLSAGSSASSGGPDGPPLRREDAALVRADLQVRPPRVYDDDASVLRQYLRAKGIEHDRRARFATPLDRAADAYLVQRGNGRTIVAGYPWFTDWGRDTFIAVRGLCLATGRVEEARDILLEWAGAVSEGMLPNRFPDYGEAPEFNSVDASLWYVVVVGELLQITMSRPQVLNDRQRTFLIAAVQAIVNGYAAGTRYGIRMDADGLLAAGTPGQQLTWMDARVGNREITPRIGKPVEIQALWYNAVAVAAAIDPRWQPVLPRIWTTFEERFWNEATGTLADVVDVDHVRGSRDDSLRPNQILAVGGLPLSLVNTQRAGRIVQAVEARLLTPLGLRSLAPTERDYAGRYEGGSAQRDAAYHQGTVWPWLIGPFVDAWLRANGNTASARRIARARFLEPLAVHLTSAGIGHVSEIADGDAPFTPRGCPFQAWSLGEYLRIDRAILTDAARLEESGIGTQDSGLGQEAGSIGRGILRRGP